MDILTDTWWKEILTNYSYTIALFWALLKGIAVLNPNTPTNKIIDLLQGAFKK